MNAIVAMKFRVQVAVTEKLWAPFFESNDNTLKGEMGVLYDFCRKKSIVFFVEKDHGPSVYLVTGSIGIRVPRRFVILN